MLKVLVGGAGAASANLSERSGGSGTVVTNSANTALVVAGGGSYNGGSLQTNSVDGRRQWPRGFHVLSVKIAKTPREAAHGVFRDSVT